MYRDLLVLALEEPAAAGMSVGQLLASLAVAGRALADTQSTPKVPSHERIADELQFDVCLVRLCTASGVEVSLQDFIRPAHERRLLLAGLAERGLVTGQASEQLETLCR
jgi:hypothetical protein